MLRRLLRPLVIRSRSHLDQQFFTRLIKKTGNFDRQTWLGQPIWQNIFDLWTIQETLCELRPALLIECGTNRGGSSYFFANLFDLVGHGRVITIDIARMHELSHPRVTYLVGSSVEPEILDQVASAVAQASGPIMVLLDSDHNEAHVRRELDAYQHFVTPGSFILVQDGIIDTLDIFAAFRPGPLPAIEAFLRVHPEFEVDTERCMRFLITHSPKGWLRRKHLPS
jgi:cephalosporin hydroxylase